MDKNKFEKIVKSNNFKLYLLDCQDKASNSSKRVWEKSIPLWIAAYFQSKGVSPHLFDGNYANKQLEEHNNHKINKKIATAILKVAGKQKRSAHADFTVHGSSKNAIVGMLEIKSLFGYQKSPFRTENIFQDICMCLVYNLFLGNTGSAFVLFLNVPYNKEQTKPLNEIGVIKELEELFKEKFKKSNKAVQLEVKKQKWENILIWME